MDFDHPIFAAFTSGKSAMSFATNIATITSGYDVDDAYFMAEFAIRMNYLTQRGFGDLREERGQLEAAARKRAEAETTHDYLTGLLSEAINYGAPIEFQTQLDGLRKTGDSIHDNKARRLVELFGQDLGFSSDDVNRAAVDYHISQLITSVDTNHPIPSTPRIRVMDATSVYDVREAREGLERRV